MNGYQNQQVPLPFNPNQAENEMVQFQMNNPPMVPQINVLPQFQHLVPGVASILANSATQASTTHCGRMFLFNQLSSNRWQNKWYTRAVQVALDLIMIAMASNRHRSPEEAVESSVAFSLSLCTSINFAEYPALFNMVTPDIANAAQGNMQKLQSLEMEANNARAFYSNQIQTRNIPNQSGGHMSYQGGYGQGGYNNGPSGATFNSGSGFMFNNTNIQNQQVQRPYGGGPSNNGGRQFGNPVSSPSGNSAIFNNTGRTDSIQNSSTKIPDSGRSYGSPFVQVDQQPVQTQQPEPAIRQSNYFTNKAQEPVVAVVETLSLSEENLCNEWKPSPIQSFLITVDASTHKLAFERKMWSDGNLYVVSFAKKLTEKEKMEYDAHATLVTRPSVNEQGSAVRAAAIHVTSMTISASTKATQLEREAIGEVTEEERYKFNLPGKPDWVESNSVDMIIAIGRVRMQAHFADKGEDPDLKVYRINGLLGIPVVVHADQQDFIDSFSECETFTEMKTMINKAKKAEITFDLAIAIDKEMTKWVNDTIVHRSGTKVIINSFAADIDDLLAWLPVNTNQRLLALFMDLQKTCAKDTVKAMEIEHTTYDNFDSVLKYNDRGDNLEVDINYLIQRYSITYIGIDNADLKINMENTNGFATGITSSDNSLLHALAVDIFNDTTNQGLGRTLRYLLVTNDGFIYELRTGLYNNKHYVIQRTDIPVVIA